ncbi:MAG: sensory box histidine kinase/response regulator [Fibrobacteres bacterium]|nr:sensory box histidine kinase/response regulator [Fibrobacterota bacterium]
MKPFPYDNAGGGGSFSGARPNGITVLLVDDDVSVRALVDATLVSQGYKVLKAYDSDQAMRLSDAHEGPIQILIADQVMPPFMSGNELASCIRLMRPEIKVLYISGYAANDGVQDELGDSSAEFLPKPFTPDLLLRKVAHLAESASFIGDKESAPLGDPEDEL